MSEVIIIGSGHNGLVAAYYLAKAGLKPIVFERRDEVGGGAITEEIHAGFRCPALSHETLLQDRIVRDMDLARHGLELVTPAAQVCSLATPGAPLVLFEDVRSSVESLRRISPRDADAYPQFRAAVERIGALIATLFESPPPGIDRPTTRDIWNLLRSGMRFRALGRHDGQRMLRWGPMAVSDFVDEWFENELLRATIAAPALSGTMFGPRSAGSTLVLLMREAHRRLAHRPNGRPRGGPGALTRAIAAAARAAGVEIRTGAPVDRVFVENGQVAGVMVDEREIRARKVVSCADPKTTFLSLVDPAALTPDLRTKLQNYRAAGAVAKVNLALSTLPAFGAEADALTGRIHIGPELDYLERAFDHAKYGELSAAPWLDITIPSLADPQLAPTGAHVASIYVHYAPYRLRHRDWDAARDDVLTATMNVLECHAPGIRSQVVAAQVITPSELEKVYAFAGGHIFHGELALDQLFTMRPLLGFARYDTPIRGLYLCGAGTHPGGFMTGASGRLAANAILGA
jgi:phytoene dehydrogenase-like protein